jgi:PAS domain S-box-containing protein
LLWSTLLLLSGIGGAAWYSVNRQKTSTRSIAERTLTSIADLKAGQIEGWMKERRGDATLVRSSAGVRQLLDAPQDPAARAMVGEYFRDLQHAYDYDIIAVFDARGELLLTTSSNRLQQLSCVPGRVQAAAQSAEVEVTDLLREGPGDPIHFSLLCPVRPARQSNGHADGVVLMVVDPSRYLFPVVQSWPVPSQSGETLLVRREGGGMVCLNETRHRKGTALNLRIPAGQAEELATAMAPERRGLVRGADYRGVSVAAVGREIHGTSWRLVAKMDMAEVDAPIHQNAWRTGFAAGLAGLAALLGMSSLWRRRTLRLLQDQLAEQKRVEAALRASEEKFSATFQFSPDAILLTSMADGRIVEINRGLTRMSGYTAEDLVGRQASEVPFWTDPAEQRRFMAEMERTGRVEDFEIRAVVKSGAFRTCLLSRTVVQLQSGPHYLSVIRDVTERRQAEEQARRWHRVFECAGFMLAHTDVRTNTFIEVNETSARAWGYTREELIGQPIARIYPPDALAALREQIQAVDETGHLVFESVHQRKDGSRFPVMVDVTTIRNTAGQPVSRVAYAQDITERKRAETAIHERELQLRVLGDNLPGGILYQVLVTPDGRIRYTYISAGVERLLGITPEQVKADAQAFWGMVVDADRDRMLAEQAQAMQQMTVFDSEFRQRTRAGEICWLRVRAQPRQMADGAVLWDGVATDITARKKAEIELQQSRELLRLVLDTIPQAVFWKDHESRYLGCNKPFAGLAGLADPAQIAGRTDFDLPWQPHETEAFRADDRTVIGTGQAKRHIIETLRRSDGVQTWIDTSKVPLLDGSGRSIGVLGVTEDITSRKQMEEALHARNEELVRFTYTVSHDLRSPLVTIQTFLGYLSQDIEKGDTERVKADFGYISRAANKMLELLEELLELSRIGRKMNPPEDILFADLVRVAMDAVAGQIASRGVRVLIAETPVLLHGDRLRLTEVFQNLLDNAVKFMGEQHAPRIEVGVEEVGQEFVFHVRDNGLGIDPRHQGRLFGLFEKLHPDLPGSGMGLALIKRIVEVHGGRIWVESAGPGQGSAFRFTLAGTRRVQSS